MAGQITATESLKQEYLSFIKNNKMTVSLITKTFSTNTRKEKDVNGHVIFNINKPIFDTRTRVHLKAGEYINKTDINTNFGIILFNKLMVEGLLEDVIPNGFYNEVLDKKKINAFHDILAKKLMIGEIDVVNTIAPYLKRYEFWTLKLATVFSISFSENTIIPNAEINKEKKIDFKNIKDDTSKSSNLINNMIKIEDKLVSEAKNNLKDDPGMGLYTSGARGSFDDVYKNQCIAVGPVKNQHTDKFDYVESNLVEGFSKEDLVAAGNIMVNSEYAKAVGTADSGYITKQFYAVFQSIIANNDGSDCGSKGTIKVLLTNDNYSSYMYQYIVDNGKLVLLNDDVKSKYIGKIVRFRSPMYCLGTNICNKCAGERYKFLDITNIGLTNVKLPNALLNAGMKARHVAKKKLNFVDIDNLVF